MTDSRASLLEGASQLRLGERKPVKPGACEGLSLDLAFHFARALALGMPSFTESQLRHSFEQAGPGRDASETSKKTRD